MDSEGIESRPLRAIHVRRSHTGRKESRAWRAGMFPDAAEPVRMDPEDPARPGGTASPSPADADRISIRSREARTKSRSTGGTGRFPEARETDRKEGRIRYGLPARRSRPPLTRIRQYIALRKRTESISEGGTERFPEARETGCKERKIRHVLADHRTHQPLPRNRHPHARRKPWNPVRTWGGRD